MGARVRGQLGLVTWRQCLAAGMTDKAVRCRLSSGRWVRLHPGVYLTEPGRNDWEVGAMAALLACGPGAALSHQSAAYAWGLQRGPGPQGLRVVVPADRHIVAPRGVVLRRSRSADERTHESAWPHRTTVEHTLLDLAHESSLDGAVGRLARAFQQRQTTERLVLQALAARPRQRHRALLLEVLGHLDDGAESPAEVRWVRDVEGAHRLPSGVRQQPTGGGRRDNVYEEFALAVEVDGRLGHEGWDGRRRDGRRDRRAARTGRLTVRVFWDELVQSPCDLAVEVGALLRARGWTGAPGACRRRSCAVRVSRPDR